MSIFFNSAAQVGDKFGVNAVNSILSLFGSDTAPTSPFTGQIWLDTSASAKVIKQWNGSSWIALFDGYYEVAFSKNSGFNKDFGSGSGNVCRGNDSRLSNARTPVSHNNTYHSENYTTRSSLWRDTTSNQTINMFIQSGLSTFSYLGTAITFDIAYTVAPRVTSSSRKREYNSAIEALSTTGFIGLLGNIEGVGAPTGTCYWVAIGRKD